MVRVLWGGLLCFGGGCFGGGFGGGCFGGGFGGGCFGGSFFRGLLWGLILNLVGIVTAPPINEVLRMGGFALAYTK